MKTLLKIIIIYLITFNNGFAACLEGDCLSGKGTLTYPDGREYVGGFKDGYFNEFGKLNGKEVIYFDGKLVNN
jgi:hypothetical protein